MSKTCSPGRFPEGRVGDSGRFPGRFFSYVIFSGPRSVPCGTSEVLCGEGVSQGAIARLPGRESGRERGKVGLGSQRDRNQDGPGRRCSWSLFYEKVFELDELIKNTESRKVPGRESRGFWKAPRKGVFMNNAQKE